MTARRIAVTGAFGFTGRAIARRALEAGSEVVTLTNRRPVAGDPMAEAVRAIHPLAFDRPAALRDALADIDTLFDTYWVRFDHGSVGYERAVVEASVLAEAARAAGVRRIVHVGITGADPASPLPYFRGKGRIDRMLLESGLSVAIVRPTVVFGDGDVLINDIAWFLRRLPVFGVPGDGRYHVQPVHVDDLARIAWAAGDTAERVEGASGADPGGATIVDAVGPETFTYRELVGEIARAIGSRARIVSLPPVVVHAAAVAAGLALRDVVLTRDEIRGLMAGLLVSRETPTGRIRLTDWLAANGDRLGRTYANELERHFRRAPAG